ncbi:MAG TPA: DNA polymerase III subunit [Acidobacteriota bacterium]|nr:DNA polymerase III subunit [Acidobacteriota bacterium]
MNVPLTLNSFLGNAKVVEILRRAVQKDRLPHAMIFSGPQGVGKCTLAVLLAQYLNCPAPGGESGCGTCVTCGRIGAVISTRYLDCTTLKEGSFCGNCANCKARIQRHPDVRIVEPEWDEKKKKKNTTISIAQVRELITEISYQPFEARYRVVILDPADQMSQGAHNSLLKTLEEPPSRTIMILVTTNPFVLLDTIRSRSRRLQFGGIPQQLIEQYLIQRAGRSAEEARLAALFSGGRLGAALSFDTDEYKETRVQALRFVTVLLTRGSFATASALAGVVAKEKEEFQLWLESVSAILQDVYFAQVAPERIGQLDLLKDLNRLGEATGHEAVTSALKWLGELKSALLRNVHRQIALEAMALGLAGRQNSPYAFS